MSKVEIEIPDDGWISGDNDIKPENKQLCVAISSITGIPMIGIFLKNVRIDKYSEQRGSYFFDVICAMEFKKMLRSDAPTFMPLSIVSRWKPLGLPKDINDWILNEIEEWFERGE